MLKDELLGLASDPHAEPLFRNQHTNMDVLYRTGETPRVKSFSFFLSFFFFFNGMGDENGYILVSLCM